MLNPYTQITQHSHTQLHIWKKNLLSSIIGVILDNLFFPPLFSQQWQLWCALCNPCDILILTYRFQTPAFFLEYLPGYRGEPQEAILTYVSCVREEKKAMYGRKARLSFCC